MQQPPKDTPFSVVSDSEEQDASEDNNGLAPVNDEAVSQRIYELETEHRDLDLAIATMEERMPYDRLSLMRLKKRKLGLKDEISKLKNAIQPDIIA